MNVPFFILIVALCYAYASLAQHPPEQEGLTVLESQLRSGVTISYKQVSSVICVEKCACIQLLLIQF